MQDLSLAAIFWIIVDLIVHIRKASDKVLVLFVMVSMTVGKNALLNTLRFFSNFFLWFRIFVSCVPSQGCRAAKLVPAVNFQCVILFCRYLVRVLLWRTRRYSRVGHFALCRFTQQFCKWDGRRPLLCFLLYLQFSWDLSALAVGLQAIFCLRNDNFHPFIPIDWPLRCDQSGFRLSLDEVNCFWIL